MKSWYKISLLGWLVTLVHLSLALMVVRGFWLLDANTPEIELFYGAFYIELFLFIVLVYAKFKRLKIFKK